jgi:hypothetical protein
MKLSKCKACRLAVLELEGQFENLDSFYVNEGIPEDTAGLWHTRCLLDADPSIAGAWYDARLRNFRDVRRYQVIAALDRWSVLQHARTKETVAVGRDGTMWRLAFRDKPRKVDGGVVGPIVEGEYHLDLDEPGVAAAAQRALAAGGAYPLSSLIEAMGLSDRMVHLEALQGGALHLETSLKRHWGAHSVSARMEYGVFVPDVLVPYLVVGPRS